MRKLNFQSLHSKWHRWVDLLAHDSSLSWILLGVASSGLAVSGLWGLFSDLFLSNLVVVAVSVRLVIIYCSTLALLVERLVTSFDRWQVEASLTYRQLFTEVRPFTGASQGGSPFYGRRFQTQLQNELARCRAYKTPLTVVVFRLELPGQAPTHAVFAQASNEVADLLDQHQSTLVGASALGMFEYGFILPNCDRGAAKKITTFVAGRLERYRCYFGLATFPDQENDALTLLRLAIEESGLLNSQAA